MKSISWLIITILAGLLLFFIILSVGRAPHPKPKSLLHGTNEVLWIAEPFADVLCDDGKQRSVTLGFRKDGVIVYQVNN